jgi:hypothetical protein
MIDRIEFIAYQSKRILFVDLSKCSAREVEAVLRALPDFVTACPLGSLLVLTDFSGATLDVEGIRVLKETAAFDKPFVKKSALMGTLDFPYGFSEELSNFSRREFSTFHTRDKALAWLAKD